VVGAGPAGAIVAWLLAELGFSVIVCEKRGDPAVGVGMSSRTINVAIGKSSIDLLSATGLDSCINQATVPLSRRALHSRSGAVTEQLYGGESDAPVSLLTPPAGVRSGSRLDISSSLIRHVWTHPQIDFQFDRIVTDIEPFSGTVKAVDGWEAEADLVVGADGVNSIVRSCLEKRQNSRTRRSDFNYVYKELHIPAEADLDRSAFHIWPRQGTLLMALPGKDESFGASYFYPAAAERSMNESTVRSWIQQFNVDYADVVNNIFECESALRNNPAGRLVTQTSELWCVGRTVLVGDACHTILPFTGKRINLAIEDCCTLANHIRQMPSLSDAMMAYFTERKVRTDDAAEKARTLGTLVLSSLPDDGVFGHIDNV